MYNLAMHSDADNQDHILIGILSSLIIVNAFLFFLSRNQTFVHIDAIAHVNKARGIFDNLTPGFRQLGTVWLPLPHLLMLPLAWIDTFWRNGAAGSLLSVVCFVGTSMFLFRTAFLWTGSRAAGWIAFMLFALNPRLIYLFTTPENEPLMIFCAAGLIYYLVRWTDDESWTAFALAGLMAFAGTLTRYEGWAMAAAAVVLVPVVARKQRLASAILFTGAAVAGPLLWMIFNMVYFDDPIIFAYGAGSAQDFASTRSFPTAGKWLDSAVTYFVDAAYCLNPAVLWLGVVGLILSLVFMGRHYWRPTIVLASGCCAMFAFYVLNLYANIVPITLPGMLENDPQAVINVRYGAVMAATIPLFAAQFLFFVIRRVERHRAFALLIVAPLFLPDIVPAASNETAGAQFTGNLFYTEAIRNQSFWMPAFVEVSRKLKEDMDQRPGEDLVLTNTRIVHVVVWATGIPIRRFMHEMNKGYWEYNLNGLDPRIRWVITEEGDQLWHAHGKFLKSNFVEVASAKTPSTKMVHLYRRP